MLTDPLSNCIGLQKKSRYEWEKNYPHFFHNAWLQGQFLLAATDHSRLVLVLHTSTWQKSLASSSGKAQSSSQILQSTATQVSEHYSWPWLQFVCHSGWLHRKGHIEIFNYMCSCMGRLSFLLWKFEMQRFWRTSSIGFCYYVSGLKRKHCASCTNTVNQKVILFCWCSVLLSTLIDPPFRSDFLISLASPWRKIDARHFYAITYWFKD